MQKIYVLKKGKFISGPFDLDKLKEKGLSETDKFWYKGLSDWQDVNALSEYGIKLSPSSETKESAPFWKKFSLKK